MKRWNLIVVALCALCMAFSATTFAREAKKPENKYPHSTRQEPKVSMSPSDQTALNKAADLLNDGKDSQAQPYVEKVLGNAKASPYAQAFAHELLGGIHWNADKPDDAIAEYRKALELNALPNNTQFDLMYRLAQSQLQSEKYEDAIATLADWEKQSGAQTADELALKANAYYRVDKFQDAVDTMKKALAMSDKPNDSWMQILMGSYFELNQFDEAAAIVKAQLQKDPGNKKLLNQLSQIYIQADKPDQALQVLAKAKSDGLITTSDDYLRLAKLYALADKPKDGAAALKEGFDKNIVQGNYDTWKLQGDLCMQAEDDACAIDAYTKASAQAKDGNVDYQLGYLQYYAGNSAQAVEAFNRALSKGGLRQEGETYLLRGDAKNELGQGAAAQSDWQKAATYPSAKTMADQRLKAIKAGVKITRGKKN